MKRFMKLCFVELKLGFRSLDGLNNESLMGVFQGSDDIGIISLSDWYIVELRLDSIRILKVHRLHIPIQEVHSIRLVDHQAGEWQMRK